MRRTDPIVEVRNAVLNFVLDQYCTKDKKTSLIMYSPCETLLSVPVGLEKCKVEEGKRTMSEQRIHNNPGVIIGGLNGSGGGDQSFEIRAMRLIYPEKVRQCTNHGIQRHHEENANNIY
jgi:hypothetical protein